MDVNNNTRVADHPIADFFKDRWSPRAFGTETMSGDDLLGLLEAARWAPSGLNAQPWRFVYSFRGEPQFDALIAALWEGNRGWAQHAAALIAITTKTTLVLPGSETEVPNPGHAFDAGAAWSHFALQAHLNGWSTHAMGGFDPAKAAAALKMPEGYAMQVVIAVGRRADADQLPEALRGRESPSPRRPVLDLAFHGTFPL
ncbi:nitroreductase family protein [Rhizobium sp. SL86]|uniref:nitroreductase family protein n=1 Tax=Rhizobium sp. SL86 TaxID=2995148 RepID=UPI0022759910|nr:nitroreductase family protein [Rhizobium sp. SL86]MCY1668053.1 nitroreductase family protein [Rhizobium sp. SL86]